MALQGSRNFNLEEGACRRPNCPSQQNRSSSCRRQRSVVLDKRVPFGLGQLTVQCSVGNCQWYFLGLPLPSQTWHLIPRPGSANLLIGAMALRKFSSLCFLWILLNVTKVGKQAPTPAANLFARMCKARKSKSSICSMYLAAIMYVLKRRMG